MQCNEMKTAVACFAIVCPAVRVAAASGLTLLRPPCYKPCVIFPYSPRTGTDAAPQGWGNAMIKRRSQILCAWFLLWDLLITGSAWIGAYYLRFEIGLIPITKSPPTISLCWKNLPLVLLLAAVAYHLAGQYAIHR